MTASRSALIFSAELWKKLQKLCEGGYPKEVCGLFFGRSEESARDRRRVERIEALENVLDGKHASRLEELIQAGVAPIDVQRARQGGFTEFLIDPKEHYQKVDEALRAGLDQIGIFHSHPDHPAQPSSTDASQPLLAGWSSVIAAVEKGRFRQARSWRRAEDHAPFQEEEILVE